MHQANLTIGGEIARIGFVWVHLQRPDSSEAPYQLSVPRQWGNQVFDPAGEKKPTDSWKVHIMAQVAQLGTLIMQWYFDNARALCGEKEHPYEWVIATLDDVTEDDSGIVIRGRAVRFRRSSRESLQPDFPVLRELR